MPKDPDALMRLASKVNGLAGDELQPWHLKASYSLSDAQGKTVEEGTIEEYWATARKDRVTYASAGKSQSTYVTETGTMRSGDLAMVPWLVKAAHDEIVQPLPDVKFAEEKSFVGKEHELGGMKLNCLSLKGTNADHPPAEFQQPTYCLSEDKPIPRLDVTMGGYRQAVRNGLVRFQGRYVAKDIRITDKGKESLTAHVDVLEAMNAADEPALTPPADARPVHRQVAISSVATGMVVKQVRPEYPMLAKERGISGMVVLQATIGTNGHILNLRVVGGPAELQQAAIDSVRQWVYKPYTLNGEPVEVETTVNVVFNIGR
jgi:TonB family protein